MYVGLLALAIGGLGAAGVGNLLTAPWVVASYVVVGVVLGVMYGAGSGFYVRLRQGLDGTDTVPRLDDDALAARLASRRPELLAATGMTGIVLLVLLMVLKPIPG